MFKFLAGVKFGLYNEIFDHFEPGKNPEDILCLIKYKGDNIFWVEDFHHGDTHLLLLEDMDGFDDLCDSFDSRHWPLKYSGHIYIKDGLPRENRDLGGTLLADFNSSDAGGFPFLQCNKQEGRFYIPENIIKKKLEAIPKDLHPIGAHKLRVYGFLQTLKLGIILSARRSFYKSTYDTNLDELYGCFEHPDRDAFLPAEIDKFLESRLDYDLLIIGMSGRWRRFLLEYFVLARFSSFFGCVYYEIDKTELRWAVFNMERLLRLLKAFRREAPGPSISGKDWVYENIEVGFFTMKDEVLIFLGWYRLSYLISKLKKFVKNSLPKFKF